MVFFNKNTFISYFAHKNCILPLKRPNCFKIMIYLSGFYKYQILSLFSNL